jgi:hypothetical protein
MRGEPQERINPNFTIAWEKALCRGSATETWYPTRGQSVPAESIATCHRCPILQECADWALRHEHFGTWGGLSERQRRKIRRQYRIKCSAPESNLLGYASLWR